MSNVDVEFVEEILSLKPAFAIELNQDGFSPMHIASANGCLEIVQELLQVDPTLSRLQGRDCWTPPHNATVKGRADIVRAMVAACAESVEDVTVRGRLLCTLLLRRASSKKLEFWLN